MTYTYRHETRGVIAIQVSTDLRYIKGGKAFGIILNHNNPTKIKDWAAYRIWVQECIEQTKLKGVEA